MFIICRIIYSNFSIINAFINITWNSISLPVAINFKDRPDRNTFESYYFFCSKIYWKNNALQSYFYTLSISHLYFPHFFQFIPNVNRLTLWKLGSRLYYIKKLFIFWCIKQAKPCAPPIRIYNFREKIKYLIIQL